MKYSTIGLFVIGFLLFTSCDKENIYDASESIELREGNVVDNKDCFEFVYPISIIFPDGSIVSVDNKEALNEAIKGWYEEFPDVDERPGLHYPVQVSIGDRSKIINNEDEMKRLRRICERKLGFEREKCFVLIYPLSYTLPDGSSISGENAKEIKEAIKQWYEDHPDVDRKPELEFPVDVKIKNGDIKTLESNDDMLKLRKWCSERDVTDKGDCIKFVYPISFEMQDGSVITGESAEEIRIAIKRWYEDHPDSQAKPNLVYPVTVYIEGKDGKITVNTEEEMIELKKKC